MNILGRLLYKSRKFYDDDFDWESYTADSYERRLKGDIESRFKAITNEGDLAFDAGTGRVEVRDGALHPNVQLILETIGHLRPASVHEVGCGGGDHIAHAGLLFPDIRVTGGDRGATQLDLAVARHPQLAGHVGIQDITMPFSEQWPKADLVYSQAVIMHIHTAVSHLVALANMVRQAGKYVLLVENVQCHNFVQDLTALAEGGHLYWDETHLYQVEGSTGARGILLSRQALALPELVSDSQIRAGEAPSVRRLRRSDQDSARALVGFQRAWRK
ncbi:methyltransferase domain-containing protein [Ruegeria marina]|uniref:Methyltransferase domain-containing protein n=1 Tax=Ruegeria marina TaxID=639004 RepID=A0A1G6JHR8_9RHOB|nr:class I SAM-dependent methyltransferase [Ruegeria marina]SDC18221.1 Methyltransferase domain-containing protein [Ruegeria marina]